VYFSSVVVKKHIGKIQYVPLSLGSLMIVRYCRCSNTLTASRRLVGDYTRFIN